MLLLFSCTKEGDTIYLPDPNEEKASTAPLVTVIYDANALGDRSYNDLIYEGVERTALELGLRTMQHSPRSHDEGLQYLEMMFSQMESARDSVRRLFIIAGTSYDEFIRSNNKRLESNPYADLLYLETPEPLASGGSTLYLPYYGAMYEAGAIQPVFNSTATLILSNPEDATVTGAAKGFADGFECLCRSYN